jgi:hypothetical protein
LAANDSLNHSPDAHCNEYMAKQLRCFAAPRSGAAKSFLAFRHPIVIISRPWTSCGDGKAGGPLTYHFFKIEARRSGFDFEKEKQGRRQTCRLSKKQLQSPAAGLELKRKNNADGRTGRPFGRPVDLAALF